MFRPRVIPVLLLMGNGLVKTVRFDRRRAIYLGDPINAVRLFNDLEADELILLDITASLEKRTFPSDLVKKIGDEAFMPFSVGGGIRRIEDIQKILALGAEKVVINTATYINPQFIAEASLLFGNQSIIVSMDVKKNLWGKYRAFIFDGTKSCDNEPLEHAKEMEKLGAGEILINFIDRDGVMKGYDLEFIKIISQAVSIPVIACGGAGTMLHLADGINIGGASAAAAGSMFVFHGERNAVLINYPEKNELLELFR
jgi:imidazole glycerol-phosphate synthase subunit HisF